MQNEHVFFGLLALSELFFSHIVESSQVLLGRPHLESTFSHFNSEKVNFEILL